MKKILKTLMVLAAMAAGAGDSHAQDVAPDRQGMDMTAHAWCQSTKMGWNLGNALESNGTGMDWETAWNNPKTTRDMLQQVRNCGFDAIRIPVQWGQNAIDKDAMTLGKAYLDRVQEVVDWSLELGFKVIINTHHEKWLEQNMTRNHKDDNCRKLKALWKQIAMRFRDYGDDLAFAGVNECQMDWKAPTTENNEVMDAYNQAFVDAVRATGGKNYYRNLVVQTYSCSPDYGLAHMAIPTDKVAERLSVEFHYYTPYSYCGDGKYYYWGEKYKKYGDTPNEGEAELRNRFDKAKTLWWDKGLGVIIGEYGVSDHWNPKASAYEKAIQQQNEQYYLETVSKEARERGFAAFVWDNNIFGNGKEIFGIFDRNMDMKIVKKDFIKAIQRGAGVDIELPTAKETTFWEGDERMDWGSGLQLKIPASIFADFTTDGRLTLTYTLNAGYDYTQIQLFDGTWTQLLPAMAGSVAVSDGKFDPAKAQNYPTSGQFRTSFSFNAETVEKLQADGMNLQGHGVNLNKVEIVYTKPTGIRQVHRQRANDNRYYDLQGRLVKQPLPRQIYIHNGRKTMNAGR